MAKQSAPKPPPDTTQEAQQSPILEKLGTVNQSVSIELGRTEASLDSVLDWSEGSLIELDRAQGDAIEVYINGIPFFRGEIVTVGEHFGVRITEIIEED
jgi:flagellar motor switch protein FliN/FliY